MIHVNFNIHACKDIFAINRLNIHFNCFSPSFNRVEIILLNFFLLKFKRFLKHLYVKYLNMTKGETWSKRVVKERKKYERPDIQFNQKHENQLVKRIGSVYTAQLLCFMFIALFKSKLETKSRLSIPQFYRTHVIVIFTCIVRRFDRGKKS